MFIGGYINTRSYCSQYQNVFVTKNAFAYSFGMKKTTGEILKELMDRHGHNAYDLEKLSDVPQPTIYRILKGQHGEPRKSTLDKLAGVYGLQAGHLRNEIPMTEHASAASNTEPATGFRGRVPLISWVQAGDFSHANDQFPPGYADEFIETTVNVGRHTFALRVKGDSMEPNFPEGAILVVEPDMDFMPGDYVIAKNGDNEATFKQLMKDGADWYLKPLNHRYPIKPLGTSAIIGVVREVIQKLR